MSQWEVFEWQEPFEAFEQDPWFLLFPVPGWCEWSQNPVTKNRTALLWVPH